MRLHLQALCTLMALCVPLSAQARSLRIDFGQSSATTGTSAGMSWNDVHTTNATAPLALVDVGGAATGIQFAFTAGLALTSANGAGTTQPVPGSPLAALGWPSSALQDTLYGSSGSPLSEFALTGLDASATYDVTLVASRINVPDSRATEFTAFGDSTTSVVAQPSNNSSQYVRLRGIGADALGTLRVTVRPHTTNDNPSAYYYINALGLDEFAAGTQPPLVGLSTNLQHVSRVAGKGPLAQSLALYTNDGTRPVVTLAAIDEATQAPPTWLGWASSGAPGTPVDLTYDAVAAGLGDHTATLSASAPGYVPASATLLLRVRASGALNLLFYGNSYSQANGGMPALVAEIAVDAGLPEPSDVARLAGGQNLAFHLNDPSQAAAITSALPPGEEWDYVVMQGHSLEATAALGNPTAFRANAVAILGNVRAHSPSARAVVFQTWARGRGHAYYQGPNPTYPRPYDMHLEIEDGYTQAVADMEAAFGSGVARRAAAGETVALQNFSPALYNPDLSHPEPAVSLLTAAAVFGALYQTDACAVVPDFAGGSGLAAWLGQFNLDLDDWRVLASYSSRVAAASQRALPGSGEDLLLRSANDGLLTACQAKPLRRGDTLSLALASPASNYAGVTAALFLDLAPTGALPGPWALHPEVQLGPLSAWQHLAVSPLGEGVGLSYTLPFSFPGWSLLVQGVAFGPSAKTGNPDFSTTDAHELRFE